MPIYEYITSGEGCEYCAEPFEVFQSIHEDALPTCPCCDEEILKLISGFMVGKGDPLTSSNLEANGFTQYKRMGKGYYEKTAGVGPNAIADGKS